MTRSLASDNFAGAHPRILAALAEANTDHAMAYGQDRWSQLARERLRTLLGSDTAEVLFVFTGTGANILGLQTLIKPYSAILCADSAHIIVDESTAPEAFLGCRIQPLPARNGKISPREIAATLHARGVEHHAQPMVVTVSQTTELGTVYSLEELRELCSFCHAHGLRVHVDGARIANACAATGASLHDMVVGTGVDVLSFGGTKNGMLFGEAVVVLDPSLQPDLRFLHKRSMQLASKMRFVGAQFAALLSDDLWLANARHANSMATLLAQEVRRRPSLEIVGTVEANAVFVRMPRHLIAPLREEIFFWIWNEAEGIVRWMTSFDTTREDIELLMRTYDACLAAGAP